MQSNSELLFRGTLNLKDFQKYQFYHTRKFFLLYFWFMVFIASFGMTLFDPATWLLNVLLSLFMSVLAMGLLILLVRFRSKREFISDSLIQQEIQYQLTEDGISQTTKNTNVLFEWKSIRSAHKNKKIYRLYVSKNKAVIIHENYFSSKEDEKRFEEIVSSHIPTSSNKLSASSATGPLALLFLGTGALVIGLIFAESLVLSELTAPPETNSSPSRPITTTILHKQIQDLGKIENEQEDESEEPSDQNTKEVGSFIFASRESPEKAHMIELREVVLADEDFDPSVDSLDDEQHDVVVRIYYGENGGILEDFVQYDPRGSFISEDFEVNWTSDNQATVNAFEGNTEGEKVLEESFEIIIEN
ncbi:YcxB family protein [Planococcus alpniumensis]|uniref:YcxB family protein n=1 Tax=Planococcus alpniumensis TaxID=2708345 RepID=UPI001B8DA4A4|nr:YcxB family protein [Planococcus sp. MSAK28401]